jgi:tetratricopeptide (TPR) repeat protein
LTFHILKYAKTNVDRFPAYFLQVESLSAQGSEVQALDLGVSTINKLGFAIPSQHLRIRAITELFFILKKLGHISDQTILQLPDTENMNMIAAMEMMSKSIDRAFSTGQYDLALLIALRGIRLTLSHGKHGTSSHFFAFLGVVCSNKGDWEKAKRFGDLSLSMAEQQECMRFATNPHLLYFVYLQHLQNPLQQALDPILSNYRISMNAGNIDDSHTCIANYVAMYFAVGLPLAPVQDDARKFVEQLSSYNRSRSLALLRIFWQFILCLMGEAGDPLVLTGEAMDQELMTKDLTANNQCLSLRALWTCRMILAYHFYDIDTAQNMMSQLFKLGMMKGHFDTPILHGFRTFIYIELARISLTKKRDFFARKAAYHVRELSKLLKAKNVNAHHIYHTCLAEQASIQKNSRIDDVIEMYRKAISSASRSGILHFAAIGNERAGIFLSQRGFPDRAMQYQQRAIELYSYWGAQAKVEQMKNSYNLSLHDTDLNQYSEGFLSRKKYSSEEADKHVSGMFKRYDGKNV